MLDVLIIGGGVTGTAIARQLARYRLDVALLEKDNDVAMGATKGNSAIVHGGFAEAHAKLKGRLCYQGRRQFAQLEEELHFGFLPIGSLVLAFDEGDLPKLEAMLENGQRNGVPDLSILNRDQILQKEPNVNPAVKYALHCQGAGVCSSYGLAIAYAENAVANGLRLHLNSPVTAIEKKPQGWRVCGENGAVWNTKYIVNAAGLAAGKIAAMAGAGSFKITPRSGEYIVLNKGTGSLVNTVLFQMPTKMGKGILVTPTVYGNLMLGPDAIDEEREDRSTHAERLYRIVQEARLTTDKIDLRRFLRSFAGVRSVADTDDFIVEETIPGFVNAAGIQSPGITSSPAIAQLVRDILADSGLPLKEKDNFDPRRRPTWEPKEELPREEAEKLLALEEHQAGRMVCRCEQVLESTITDAAQRGIPLTSVDAIKRRCRASMGFCQGQFCRPRTASLLSGIAGVEVSPQTDAQRDGLARVGRDEMLAYLKQKEQS